MAVQLDQQLLEILACPCPEHAPLAVGSPTDAEADALTCTSCGRIFPVQDGIPVLLLDEATGGPSDEQPAAAESGDEQD
ncbi:hypothetical protein EV191_10955 [Tamaricihabitans halophyticus]|uniref:UPF0434 protein EV191_10955 n=1 Tax=Tamaricihabitans halophyticus TaxID=1262583 RepID=A0A4R2QIP8_9PSEU|nr:Trm112 family protein [Tamaricihabitans halophyticus]TCP49233.1 hypothetical protein EV191_10955 [Tamaricihabitans halophyticus]